MSDRDTCVSVYLSVGIHTFSLLPDLTALANHLAAFIPLATFCFIIDAMDVFIKRVLAICFGKLVEGVRLSC